jgi:hypothetical protein
MMSVGVYAKNQKALNANDFNVKAYIQQLRKVRLSCIDLQNGPLSHLSPGRVAPICTILQTEGYVVAYVNLMEEFANE